MNPWSFRKDLSDNVIHFTRGETPMQAFSTLRKIVFERRLIGSGEMIKEERKCVCFTETPLACLSRRGFFFDRVERPPYQPFGLMFAKSWVFNEGGRHVIYQTSEEFAELPESVRFRHARYEIGGENKIDFTWEREWRICCEELHFGPGDATIVLPNQEWRRLLISEHSAEQDHFADCYSVVCGRQIAELHREPFEWEVVTVDSVPGFER